MDIYDYTVLDSEKKEVNLSAYKGKVLLIVNTATGCGYTPQYNALQLLYTKYKDRGLEILDFPCNQFMGQAPGTEAEIVQFCQVNFGVTFKTFAKIKVNGKDAEPLFTYLKQQAPADLTADDTGELKKMVSKITRAIAGQDIKWNFTKFLVDRQGNVVARFGPPVKPEKIEPLIVDLLDSES